jgi:nitrate/nitrite transporter NarK
MIDRLLYMITALALASIFAFDENFAANLSRALGGAIADTPLNSWEAWLCIIFLGLAVAALYREHSR